MFGSLEYVFVSFSGAANARVCGGGGHLFPCGLRMSQWTTWCFFSVSTDCGCPCPQDVFVVSMYMSQGECVGMGPSHGHLCVRARAYMCERKRKIHSRQ